jgi:protein-S-isoprenylcysteine O-methyltransferase Ste14
MAETVLVHPNRDKAASKATKAAVILLLLVSAGLVLLVTVGGWGQLQGAQMVSVLYIVIYLVIAYFVARWNRGTLPVVSVLAILLLVVAAIAGPPWFDRDATDYQDSNLPAGMLGLLTLLIVPVQALLIIFAMRGFTQKWNVEVEVTQDEYDRRGPGGFEAQPQT